MSGESGREVGGDVKGEVFSLVSAELDMAFRM